MPTDFDLDLAFARLRDSMATYPKAAMFQLAEEGYCSLFEQLIACIISIRTYDEVSLPVAQGLFAQAREPLAMSQFPIAKIQQLIARCTYAERKAVQIHEIARSVVTHYDGKLPCEEAVLLGFKGVGPKCAHLALGIACQQPYISVDVHVHRVVNRWGYVRTKSPQQTTKALEAKLPKRDWIDTNRLLMPFGKQICQSRLPRCHRCPLSDMCPKIGVETDDFWAQ